MCRSIVQSMVQSRVHSPGFVASLNLERERERETKRGGGKSVHAIVTSQPRDI